MLNISAQIGKTVSATFFRAFAGVRSLNMVIKHKPAPAMLDAVIEHVVSAFSPKLGKQHACNCTLDALQRTASLFGRDPDQHIECMLCTLEFFHRNGMALPPNFDTNIFIEALKSVAAVHYQGLKQRPVETYLRAAMALKAGGVGYYPRSGFVHVDTGDVRYW